MKNLGESLNGLKSDFSKRLLKSGSNLYIKYEYKQYVTRELYLERRHLNARVYFLYVKQNTKRFAMFLLSQRYLEGKRITHLLLTIRLFISE